MSDAYNPYAPPKPTSEGPARPVRRGRGGGAGIWAEGGLLVFDKERGRLPDRCVVCNRSTDYKMSRNFSWHPQWLFILALAGWIIYLIVASLMRKYVKVDLGLCEEHRKRRINGLIISGVGVGASVLFIFIGASSHSSAMLFLAFLGVVVSAVVGGQMARVMTVTKIDNTHAYFKVGPAFLQSLPTDPDDGDEESEPVIRRVKKKKKKVKKPAAESSAGEPGPAAETGEEPEEKG